MNEFNLIVRETEFRGGLVDVYWNDQNQQIAVCEPGAFPEDADSQVRGGDTAQSWLQEITEGLIALVIRGGQGVYDHVFQVVRVPRAQFERHTRGGSASPKLGRYARRRALMAGVHPGNRIYAIPVAWIHWDYTIV